MLKKITFSLLLSICCYANIYSQTSDQLSYDIVLDVSGSVSIFDKNNNLKTLLAQTINADFNKAAIKSHIDFNIYFIGSNATDVLGKSTFTIKKHGNTKEAAEILNAIDEHIKKSHKEQQTHLHTALDKIITLKKNTNTKVSGGVFIFSDAQINQGDFIIDPTIPFKKDVESYRNGINLRIAEIEQKLNIPVFIVQSFLSPSNHFAIIADSLKTSRNEEIISTNNWFWIKNDVVALGNKNVEKAFSKFLDNANVAIISRNQLIPKNDVIATTLKFYEITEILNKTEKTDLLTTIQAWKANTKSNLNQVELAAAETIAKVIKPADRIESGVTETQKQTVDISEITIKDLQQAIKQLSSSPELLRELRKRAANAVDDQLNLITDHAIDKAMSSASKVEVAAVQNTDAMSMQAAALNGIAKYLTRRVKEEIAFHFIERINDSLINNDKKYIEISKYLFPNTKQQISTPENYYDFTNLRTAMVTDLNELPDNLMKHADLFGKSEGLVALKYFYDLHQGIKQSNSLELSFERLAKGIEQKLKNKAGKRVYDILTTDTITSKIEQSILFTARLVGYLNNHDLSKIYIDHQPDTLTKLLTLLSLDVNLIKKVKYSSDKMGAIINNVYLKYNDYKTTASKYKQLLGSPIKGRLSDFNYDQAMAVNELLAKIGDLMLSGSDILNFIEIEKIINSKDASEVTIRSAQNTLKAYSLFREHKYVEAINLLIPELNIALKGQTNNNPEVMASIGKVMRISGNLATATTSEDIENIIAKNALPPASYRDKRSTLHSFYINGYLGVGATTYMYTANHKRLDPRATLLAPVGIEFGSLCKKLPIGIMVSLIDVGNIINYQWENNGADQNDKAELARAIAPGLYATFGLSKKKIPLSIIAGYQINPSRFNLGIAFDLPILRLYKSR